MKSKRSRLDSEAQASALPTDLAVLMVGIAARQAASPTALDQARIAGARAPDATLFAPVDGAFNGSTAAAMTGWKER